MIDIPQHKPLKIPKLLYLPKGPKQRTRRRQGLGKRRLGVSPVNVVPVGLCQPMIWIYPQQIIDVGGKAIVEIEPWVVRTLLYHHRVIVAGLGETIQFMLFRSDRT